MNTGSAGCHQQIRRVDGNQPPRPDAPQYNLCGALIRFRKIAVVRKNFGRAKSRLMLPNRLRRLQPRPLSPP
jgi:hypothetical protein